MVGRQAAPENGFRWRRYASRFYQCAVHGITVRWARRRAGRGAHAGLFSGAACTAVLDRVAILQSGEL